MVRQAYIAGESAPSLVRRFDAGYANLRWRARIEGWTRKQIAETLDLKPLRGGADDPRPALMALADLDGLPEPPTVAPREAVARAVRRAAWLVSEGKANEASLLLRAAEALNKLAWAAKG